MQASDSGCARIIGDGEMATLVRAFDWSSTTLGPIEGWSIELVTIVNLTLCSASPARTMWGPDFILIYNDAYRPIPGPRHPAALGKAAREVYEESWHVVGPLLENAFATGKTLFYEKLLVPLPTANGIENFYLNYSFNPIFESGKIAGLFGPLHDVTAEVVAARRLLESEARASRILQSIGDAVIVMDAEGRVTHVNPVAETLTGWSAEEANGQPLSSVFRIVDEVSREVVESPAEKIKHSGKVVGLANHTILIRKDGSETPIDDSGAPIIDENGQLQGIVLVFRNIEDRRTAEREKERLSAQLAQVLDVTSDAVVAVNRNWVMTYLNPKAIEIYAGDQDLVGLNIWEKFPDAGYQGSPYIEHYSRAMNEGVSGSFEAHYPEPLNRWLRIEVHPTRDGIVTFSRDISKEKRDRQKLQEKSEQTERQRAEIESLYQTAPVGLALFSADEFRYLRLNDKQAEFFGLRPEQVLGRTLTEMAPIDNLGGLFERVLTGEPVINFPLEGELVTRPGETRYWMVSYFPVFAADGTVRAITAASLEVTQQKKTEMALIQSEKLAVVGRLAASIAHEINNPLESVTNLLFLVGGSNDLAEIKQLIRTADEELRRVSAIASQTLRFHRQSTKPREVTCESLLDSVTSLYQSRILNSGVSLEERKRARCAVRCFEGEIRQVLSNLVSNALDALPVEGARLLLRTRRGTDWQTGRAGIVVTVADNGSGMPASVLHRIFEPFYTTKEIGGTGLGLWVSREIINRHRGALRVRSGQRPGRRGTVFTMFLPFDSASR